MFRHGRNRREQRVDLTTDKPKSEKTVEEAKTSNYFDEFAEDFLITYGFDDEAHISLPTEYELSTKFSSNNKDLEIDLYTDNTDNEQKKNSKDIRSLLFDVCKLKSRVNTETLNFLELALPSLGLYDAIANQEDWSPKLLQRSKRTDFLRPACLYVLNHVEFEEHNYRAGSDKDVEAIKRTMRDKLQLRTEICRNYSVEQLKQLVEQIKGKDFSNHSAIVIVILSHGERYDKIAAYNGSYEVKKDILFPMLENETLSNKPKLFFIQACKGQFRVDNKQDASAPTQPANEVFIFYSTFEGFVSYRNPYSGSMFIQTLCNQLEESGLTKNIKDIAEDVKKAFRDRYSALGQVPTIEENLISDYKFGDYVVKRFDDDP